MFASVSLRGRRVLAGVVLGTGLVATAALAQPASQTGPPTLPSLQPQKPIGAIRIPEKMVTLKKNAAVAHQPFELKDPNGKPIDPNQKVTLPDGKQVTAREYVDDLNQLEKALNAIGHSLRNRDKVPASLAVDKALFDRQAEQAKKSFKIPRGLAVKQPRMTAEMRQKREAEVKDMLATFKAATATGATNPAKPKISPDVLTPPKGPATSKSGVVSKLNKNVGKDPVSSKVVDLYRPEVVEASKLFHERAKQKAAAADGRSWRAEFGDRGLFASDLSATMDVRSQMDGNGDNHTSSIFAMTQGGGYIVNNRVDVFRAAAVLNTDHQRQTKLHLQIDLFGKTLTNQDVGPGEGDANTANLDLHVGPIEIPVGPAYVTGEYLLRAKVGMHYNLQVDAGRAILEVLPTVSSTLGHWRGGGIGFKGAAKIGASFGGTLTWINQQLYLRGEAAKGIEKPSYRPFVSVSYHGHNNFEALAGTLEIKGKLNVLGFNTEGTLASTTWPGVRVNGVIFEDKKVEYPR